jgi:hypothetical protein
MRLPVNVLIVALLQVMMISIPANAQNLWNIYSDKEEVIIILETRQNWKATNLPNYQHIRQHQCFQVLIAQIKKNHRKIELGHSGI